MKAFGYYQPTKIVFGRGKVKEAGKLTARFGRRCLIVTFPEFDALTPVLGKTRKSLEDAGISAAHFDGVVQNPTTECIAAGAERARAHGADVVLGLGGGSSMDAAKAIAVEAAHEGGCWDYLYYKARPTKKTLPVIAVSTTSGTGAQVTQVAVVTDTETRDKSALFHPRLFPKVAIVDPELMITVPKHITAATGFDAFCHAFESVLHPNASPYIELMAWEALELIVSNLPKVLDVPSDLEARSAMAWADTLAGLCIANAGVTLPHNIGMAIGGRYPHLMHGETLALNYPAFTRFTHAAAVEPFAKLGRLLNPALANENAEAAAAQSCEELDTFLKKTGLWMGLADKGIPEGELPALAKQSMVLPDCKGNPRVIESEEEMLALLRTCCTR